MVDRTAVGRLNERGSLEVLLRRDLGQLLERDRLVALERRCLNLWLLLMWLLIGLLPCLLQLPLLPLLAENRVRTKFSIGVGAASVVLVLADERLSTASLLL